MRRSKRLITGLLLFFSLIVTANVVSAATYEIGDTQKLKVLVISIDPYLETQQMYATQWLKSSTAEEFGLGVSEDLKLGSNGIIETEIVGYEYLREFPKYTEKYSLFYYDEDAGKYVITGTDNQLDERSYLTIFKNHFWGWTEGDNPFLEERKTGGADFDYEDLIERFDLVNRRNQGEFDMVWIVGVEPGSAWETCMVGRTAYWVNGMPIKKDCDNFVIAFYNHNRLDAAFHDLGHYMEFVMDRVFEDLYEVDYEDARSIDELNTWQKFTMTQAHAPKGVTNYGVGNVHFSPNSSKDYDWENKTVVQSSWLDWKENYPELTGETTDFDCYTYFVPYSSIATDRQHLRWWFSCMPHVKGRDTQGVSYNWWDYFYSTNYVERIKRTSGSDWNIVKGKSYDTLPFEMVYQSKAKKTMTTEDIQWDNYEIANPSIAAIENGRLVAKKIGSTKLTVYYDGRSHSVNIQVRETPEKITVGVNKDEVLVLDHKLSLNASTKYSSSIKYSSSDPSIAKVSSYGRVTAVSEGEATITLKSFQVEDVVVRIKVVPEEIQLEKKTVTVVNKTSSMVGATAVYGTKLTYTSADPSIATVSSKGKITGKKDGKTIITMKGSGVSKQVTVKVVTPSIRGLKSEYTVKVGEKITIPYKISNAGEITAKVTVKDADNYWYYWSYEAARLEKSSNSEAVLKGIKAGKAKLVIQIGDVKHTAKVIVK